MNEIFVNLGPADQDDEGPDVFVARCPQCNSGFVSEDKADATAGLKSHLQEKHPRRR